MKTCLIALLAIFATPALAQENPWEDPFDFGDANAELDPIAPVHLIHLHTGKVLAITYAGFDQPCDPSCTTVCVARIYLWTPPPIADPGDPGDFEDMHHCRINLFCAVNIACGESISLLELLKAMAKLLHVKPDCEFAPPRAGDVRHSLASIAAAKNLIGYEPIVAFEDGLRCTLRADSASA